MEHFTPFSFASFRAAVRCKTNLLAPLINLAELLAEDFATQIFRDVTSAKLMERETLGSKTCDRLHFVQPGLTGDLWVNVEDHLPVRYLLTFTSLDANPTWEINLTDWILNAPVDATLFTKRPAADSIKVEMGKSE